MRTSHVWHRSSLRLLLIGNAKLFSIARLQRCADGNYLIAEILSRISALIRHICDRRKKSLQEKGKTWLGQASNKLQASYGLEFRRIMSRKFYGDLFGWKIERFPGPHEYWHIDTGGADATPDGGLKPREQPGESIVNYISVDSVGEFSKKIEKLGGKICMAKTAVPQMGYFAVCQDTEGNAFGIWESDTKAK